VNSPLRLLLLALIATSCKGDSNSKRPGSAEEACYPPTGPMPNAAIIGHWFATDRRAHSKTFGLNPPDSASVILLQDSATIESANRALDSTLDAMDGGKADPNAPKYQSFVYDAGSIYALVDIGQKVCGGDVPVLPVVFFLDSSFHLLGSRSN